MQNISQGNSKSALRWIIRKAKVWNSWMLICSAEPVSHVAWFLFLLAWPAAQSLGLDWHKAAAGVRTLPVSSRRLISFCCEKKKKKSKISTAFFFLQLCRNVLNILCVISVTNLYIIIWNTCILCCLIFLLQNLAVVLLNMKLYAEALRGKTWYYDVLAYRLYVLSQLLTLWSLLMQRLYPKWRKHK